MARSLLWVLPKWPLPATDGSRQAAVQLLRKLTELGETIDAVVIAPPGDYDLSELQREMRLRHVFLLKQAHHPDSLWERLWSLTGAFLHSFSLPWTTRFFSGRRLRRQMAGLLRAVTDSPVWSSTLSPVNSAFPAWDFVVYEGPHPAAHAARWGRYRPIPGSKVVYRAQNCETALWRTKTAHVSSFIFKRLLSMQTAQMRRFEGSVVKAAAAVAVVSGEDLGAFGRELGANLANGKPSDVIPVGFDDPLTLPKRMQNPYQLLFVGRFDWYPNRDGVIWFLTQVWPELLKVRDDLQVALAGSGAYTVLQRYLKQPRIRFLGEVLDLRPLYRESLMAIVPIFYGGGIRVKAIEAGWHKLACLSTSLGVQGLGFKAGESCFQAETASEWIGQLAELNADRAAEAGRKAYETVSSKFSAVESARRFQSLLDRAESC